MLDGHSLTEAAKFYIKYNRQDVTAKSVADAVSEFSTPNVRKGAPSYIWRTCVTGWDVLLRHSMLSTATGARGRAGLFERIEVERSEL